MVSGIFTDRVLANVVLCPCLKIYGISCSQLCAGIFLWGIFIFLFDTLTILSLPHFALLEVPITLTEYTVECKFGIFETRFEKISNLSNLCTFALTYINFVLMVFPIIFLI